MPRSKFKKQLTGLPQPKPRVTVGQAVDNIVALLRSKAAGKERNRRVLQWEELAQALGKGKGAARIAFLRNLNPNLRRGSFSAEEVMMVACLHLKLCRTSESPISEIGVALGTTDAYGLPLDFRSPFDISDLLRKTAEKARGDCPPRSAAYSLFFFHYSRRLAAVMAQEDFVGHRAWDLLAWNFRKSILAVIPGEERELELLLRALNKTGQLAKFGFRTNTLPTDMCRAVQQLQSYCARRDNPRELLWGRTRHRTPVQMLETVPAADGAVHITSAPAAASVTSTAQGPVAGHASADKLLALLRAAGLTEDAGEEFPGMSRGRPQLWRTPLSAKGRSREDRKSARNVRRRLSVDV